MSLRHSPQSSVSTCLFEVPVFGLLVEAGEPKENPHRHRKVPDPTYCKVSIEIPIYLALHEQSLSSEVELSGGRQINSFPEPSVDAGQTPDVTRAARRSCPDMRRHSSSRWQRCILSTPPRPPLAVWTSELPPWLFRKYSCLEVWGVMYKEWHVAARAGHVKQADVWLENKTPKSLLASGGGGGKCAGFAVN